MSNPEALRYIYHGQFNPTIMFPNVMRTVNTAIRAGNRVRRPQVDRVQANYLNLMARRLQRAIATEPRRYRWQQAVVARQRRAQATGIRYNRARRSRLAKFLPGSVWAKRMRRRGRRP